MKRQVLFAAAALSASLSFGFTANRWQPVAGDWNGDYSDVAHWSLGHLPDMSAETGGEDANSFAADSEVKVKGGTLAWTGEQSVGRLTLAAGTTLEPGGILSVAGDLSLDGVALRLTGPDAWTEIIKVPAGCAITGTPVAKDMRCRIVDLPSGGQALMAKRLTGLFFVIR